MAYRVLAPFPRGTRVLVVAAHPDDVEAGFPNTIHQMLKWGCEITMVYSTGGEYGATDRRKHFRGKRLRRIRRREMERTIEAYEAAVPGAPSIDLVWLGEIDGHVVVDAPTREKLRRLLARVDPRAIFVADPFLSIDWHPDHIRTAFMTWQCWKALPATRRPVMLGYFTIQADCYVPYARRHDHFRMMLVHRSQTHYLLHGVFHRFVRLVQGYNRRKVGYLAEGFRLLSARPPSREHLAFATRVRDHLTRRAMAPLPPSRYTPSPEALGLR